MICDVSFHNLAAFYEAYLNDPGQDICFYSCHCDPFLAVSVMHLQPRCLESMMTFGVILFPFQVSKENRNALLQDILSALHECLKQ